jgi:hypothetical protein
MNRRAIAIGCALVAVTGAIRIQGAEPRTTLTTSIFEELNRLRADPLSYVATLREMRRYYRGDLVEIPGQPDLLTREGARPLDEAIRFLLSSRLRQSRRLELSKGLSRAALDHVMDSGSGGFTGHVGADGSDMGTRLRRYGTWSGEIGEVISYGPSNARDVIAGMLIDDGVPDRGHRKSLLDPAWNYAGIACGSHAVYGMMCVIDFATGYRDR